MLVVYKLRRRQVAGAAQFLRMDHHRRATFDRLAKPHSLHLSPALAAADLRPKTE